MQKQFFFMHKIFSLSLTMMCQVVFSLYLSFFGIFWALWICKLVFCTTLEKIIAIFLICSIIPFQTLIPSIMHDVVPKVTKTLFLVFFQFFKRLCSSDWMVPICVSSSSLILSSAKFKLCYKTHSSKFFISNNGIFSFKISFWFLL